MYKTSSHSTKYFTYDFGEGFYLTQNPEEAIEFANSHSNTKIKKLGPVIIRMNMDDFFNNTHVLRFNKFNDKFIKFILYCRISGYRPRKINGNTIDKHYSAIFGPTADGNIRDYVRYIRERYFLKGYNIDRILNNINYSKLKTKLKLNKYFPKEDQLCLINKKYIVKYIHKKNKMTPKEVQDYE